MKEQISIEEEKYLYQSLTSMTEIGFKNKIKPKEGNKTSLTYVLKRFEGYDFSQFFTLLKGNREKLLQKEYAQFVEKHPLVELLGKFIDCGFLDEKLNFNDYPLIDLGTEILDSKTLGRLKIKEGLILRDGRLFPVNSSEAHRLGCMWLYLNGYRVEDMVRYTSDYFDGTPVFSSTSDYIERPSNEIVLFTSQAIALYNIFKAKCPTRDFCQAIQTYTDLGLIPFANPQLKIENAKVFETALGDDIFDRLKVLKEIKDEEYLMSHENS